MCGVLRTNSRDRELVVSPQEAAAMPPSVTVGEAEASKGTPPPPQHLEQQHNATTNKDIPTIDLAACESDDLQKAIALSLQEQNDSTETSSLAGISAEEQDVSKALEVSLQESSSSTTIDMVNPHDRKRIADIPVGLKNIGNSCWFNVVVQSLFFIPAFRDLIINFPNDMDTESTFSKSPSRLLVSVLRHVFSLLVGSSRKYVDPSEAVKLFQGQDMRKNTQQDVCEFIHKLLEKLEEDFKLLAKQRGLEKECSECNIGKESDFENPIMNLFYGTFIETDETEDFKLETFGQHILGVMRYKDIHESILASMTGGVTEDGDVSFIKPTQQVKWFKTLPSVLIFSLSRYEYSKEKKRAEKVHNKFDFPEYMYMDRYMESNKDIVNKKHLKIAEIKQELKSLNDILNKYERFGSGECKYPIADILKYTLEFAVNEGKKETSGSLASLNMEVDCSEAAVSDVEMAEPKDDKMKEMDSDCLSQYSASHSSAASGKVSPPFPQNVYSNELAVLQSCLPRWQNEVEVKVNALRKSIEELEMQLMLMFEEPHLQRVPYKLHAVVVHEGQASGGHYWVYIYDSFKNIWMKFNDNQVTLSNWHEVMNDSIGGQNNASAYCLMYVDQTRYSSLFLDYKQKMDCPSYLSIDLQEFIKQDNLVFKGELEEWERKQESINQKNPENGPRNVPAAAPNSPELNINEEDTRFFFGIQTMLSQTLAKAFQSEGSAMQEKNWLDNIVKNELTRLKELTSPNIHSDCCSEPSILDLGIYLTKNNQKDILVQWYAFEIVWQISQTENTIAMDRIRHEAVKALQRIQEKYLSTHGAIYDGWKKHYRNLVTCTWYFICGYRKYVDHQLEIALGYLMQALKINQRISDTSPSGNAKTLDFKVLGWCHRKCLLLLNDKLVDAFVSAESEDRAFEEAQTVNRLILPSLLYVNHSKDKEDELAGNVVLNKWCQLIGSVTDASKCNLIKQIIELLTSDNRDGEFRLYKIASIPTVLSLYKEYRDSAASILACCNKTDAQISDL